jgi:hypothetical protein
MFINLFSLKAVVKVVLFSMWHNRVSFFSYSPAAALIFRMGIRAKLFCKIHQHQVQNLDKSFRLCFLQASLKKKHSLMHDQLKKPLLGKNVY